MGTLASKFYETKTFYNLTVLAAPKARCTTCKKWNRRAHLFRYNGKRYCSECAPDTAFNTLAGPYHSLPTQQILRDDTPLL
jgi:hypothetical protein